jgi:molybdopterin-biosynthesis enzyme MoeA-like protein
VLNDDDKQWIASRIEKTETSLRGEFGDRFEKLETRSADRFAKLETTLADRFERTESTFAERLERVEATFADRLERVETTLLTEFHKWASPVELRQRSHAAAMRAFDAELQALSDRVKNLEGR